MEIRRLHRLLNKTMRVEQSALPKSTPQPKPQPQLIPLFKPQPPFNATILTPLVNAELRAYSLGLTDKVSFETGIHAHGLSIINNIGAMFGKINDDKRMHRPNPLLGRVFYNGGSQ